MRSRSEQNQGGWREALRRLAAFERIGLSRAALLLFVASLVQQPTAGQGTFSQPQASASAQSSATPSSTPEIEIPRPSLEGLEPAIREQIQQAQEALAELQQTHGSGDQVRAIATLGQIYHAYGLIGAAIACYEIAAQGTVDLQWSYYLAHTLRESGRFAESNGHLQEVIRRGGDGLPEVQYYLGMNHLELGDLDAAEQALQAGLELAPNDPALVAGLGEVALARQQYQRAVELLSRALEAAPAANRLHYPLAQAYRALGKADEARAHLEQFGSVGVKPRDPLLSDLEELRVGATPHLLTGRIAFAAGRFQEAADAFARAVTAQPDAVGGHINLATALDRLGRRSDAISRYRVALEVDPESATAHYNLGVLLRLDSQLQEAVTHLSRAVELQPNDAGALLELAETYRQLGNALESARHANAARKIDSLLDHAWWLEASALVQLGEYRAALGALQQGLQYVPRSARLLGGLARIYAEAPDESLRDPERAATAYTLSYRADPTVENALNAVAALVEVDRCADAGEILDGVLATAGLVAAYGDEQVSEMRAWRAAMAQGPPCRR